MTWTIYAIREIGSVEARYIGQSGKSGDCRLAEFVRFARRGEGDYSMSNWLRSIGFQAEVITIATAKTLVEARVLERAAIGMFSQFGHRLFNRALIDPALKAPLRPRHEPWVAPSARAPKQGQAA